MLNKIPSLNKSLTKKFKTKSIKYNMKNKNQNIYQKKQTSSKY